MFISPRSALQLLPVSISMQTVWRHYTKVPFVCVISSNLSETSIYIDIAFTLCHYQRCYLATHLPLCRYQSTEPLSAYGQTCWRTPEKLVVCKYQFGIRMIRMKHPARSVDCLGLYFDHCPALNRRQSTCLMPI